MVIYDVVVVGGGPSGLSSAIYSSRAKLKTLLVEKKYCGGHLAIIDWLENYPGFNKGISGFDFAAKLEKQVKSFCGEIVCDEVIDMECGPLKRVITGNANYYKARAVVIASGTHLKEMNIPGELKFRGQGVSYCATCDGPFCKGKDILVVGGGNSAVQESIYLSRFAKKVVVVNRKSELRATGFLQKRLASCANVSVIYDSILKEISGGKSVEGVIITNLKSNQSYYLKVGGVFIFIGVLPNNSFFSNIILDKDGYIVTDEDMNTSVHGVFACGDIRKKQLRQVITAVSDGAQAAASVQHYLENI
jgi:thioredoxin reductase (NADPH)